jgi:hypothetical protein
MLLLFGEYEGIIVPVTGLDDPEKRRKSEICAFPH